MKATKSQLADGEWGTTVLKLLLIAVVIGLGILAGREPSVQAWLHKPLTEATIGDLTTLLFIAFLMLRR